MSPNGPRRALQRLRDIPAPPAFLVALVASFVAVVGVSNALVDDGLDSASIDNGIEKPGMYPATPRVVVASGTIPGVGDYQLTHARDYKGGMCVGLLLKGGDGRGGDVLSEGCGGAENLNIGKLTAGDGSWTILHGKAPQDTDVVEAKQSNGTTLSLPVTEDGKGIDGGWVVKKVTGTVGDVEFNAVDNVGRKLGSMELAR
jgi:hypothetical protein